MVADVVAAISQVDRNVPRPTVRTGHDRWEGLLDREQMFAHLASLLGLLTVGLASVGLYGLMSHAVLRRTGEIGLRMALGALPRRMLGMILRESLVTVGVGLVLGFGAACAATRLIAAMLFGLSPLHLATHVFVAFFLAAVAVLSCLLPAHRAERIDPVVALRCD